MRSDPFADLPPNSWPVTTRVTPEQMRASQAAESARIAKAVEEREQRDAAAQRERDAAEQAQGRAELAAYEGQAHTAYLASGGDAGGWPGVWNKLKAEHLADAARERLTGK